MLKWRTGYIVFHSFYRTKLNVATSLCNIFTWITSSTSNQTKPIQHHHITNRRGWIRVCKLGSNPIGKIWLFDFDHENSRLTYNYLVVNWSGDQRVRFKRYISPIAKFEWEHKRPDFESSAAISSHLVQPFIYGRRQTTKYFWKLALEKKEPLI